MNIINRAAIESSCRFVEEKIAPRKCDNDAVGSCWRCNSVYLAKRMRDLLNAHPAPTIKDSLSVQSPPIAEWPECKKCGGNLWQCMACHPTAVPVPEQNYAKCWVCGKPMDGTSEDDCHCFHRKELAAQPVALSTLTDAQIEQIWLNARDDKNELKAAIYFARAILAASAPAQQVTPPQPVAAEVVTDARRLDWLARNLFTYKWNGVIDSGSRTDWFVRGDYRHTMQKMNGTTLRIAIDSAMAGTGSDESKENGK